MELLIILEGYTVELELLAKSCYLCRTFVNKRSRVSSLAPGP